jgi:hypothetical protein
LRFAESRLSAITRGGVSDASAGRIWGCAPPLLAQIEVSSYGEVTP